MQFLPFMAQSFDLGTSQAAEFGGKPDTFFMP